MSFFRQVYRMMQAKLHAKRAQSSPIVGGPNAPVHAPPESFTDYARATRKRVLDILYDGNDSLRSREEAIRSMEKELYARLNSREYTQSEWETYIGTSWYLFGAAVACGSLGVQGFAQPKSVSERLQNFGSVTA